MIITGSTQTSCYLCRPPCPGSYETFAYRFAWARVERVTFWQSSVAGRPRGEAGAPIPGHPEPAHDAIGHLHAEAAARVLCIGETHFIRSQLKRGSHSS